MNNSQKIIKLQSDLYLASLEREKLRVLRNKFRNACAELRKLKKENKELNAKLLNIARRRRENRRRRMRQGIPPAAAGQGPVPNPHP